MRKTHVVVGNVAVDVRKVVVVESKVVVFAKDIALGVRKIVAVMKTNIVV